MEEGKNDKKAEKITYKIKEYKSCLIDWESSSKIDHFDSISTK